MLRSAAMKRSRNNTGRLAARGLLASAIVTVAAVGTLAGTAGASSSNSSEKATGSTVTVGMIIDAGGAGGIGTSVLVEQGAKAAVDYVNDDLDGLEGHKVALYVCENQNSPAGGQTCANDMVQKGVVADVEAFTGQGQTEVPTITGAGIPYITISGASTAELTDPGAYDIDWRLSGLLGCPRAERQGARHQEGGVRGRQCALGDPGRTGAGRHRLQVGRGRARHRPRQHRHGRHDAPAAVRRLERCGCYRDDR